MRIGIWSLTEHQERPATETLPGTANIHSHNTFSSLSSQLTDVDFSVIIAHGGIEYSPIPPGKWREKLRALGRMGSDLIIGHHPHCPQGWESFHGSTIIYSLGNFLMYRENKPSTHWSIVPEITVGNGKVKDIQPHIVVADSGRVTISRNKSDYAAYLKESSEILSNDRRYFRYWQHLALDMYNAKYRSRIGHFGLGFVNTLLRNPIRGVDLLTRGVIGKSLSREQEIRLLDIVQNQSHLDVIRTALEIKTEQVTEFSRDQRIENHLEDLYVYSGDPLNRDTRTVGKRFSDRLETFLDRLT